MTTVSAAVPGTADSTRTDRTRSGDGTDDLVLTVGEVCALVGVTLVATVGTWSLALAQAGRHDGVASVGLGVLTTVVLGAAAVVSGRRPTVRFDRAEAALVVGVVVVAGFFFLPGFHYSWNDKDPGAYVLHGFAIARDGDVYVDDEVVERGIEPAFDQAGRFPGLWPDDDHPGQVTSQFFHFYSALLATAHDLGGARALFNVNPVLAIGSVTTLVLATRRAAGTLVAALAGALLVTSMMEVWQAKYPSTEVPAQFLLAGALLAGMLSIVRAWAGGALVAGVLLGVGFLARPDGFLYILIGVCVAGLAIAADRADRRVAAFLAGLALTVPYAIWNAMVARPKYAASNSVPGGAELVAVIGAVLGGGLLVRFLAARLRRRWPDARWLDASTLVERWGRPVGAVTALLFGAALVLFAFRPEIWGEAFRTSTRTGLVERSYNELNLQWLGWFVTVRGLIVMWFGFAVVMLRRWRASLMLLVIPGSALLLLYLYDARVSMRLMWWVRRFIPAVVPAILVLIAIGLAWALTRRSKVVKLAGAAVALSLVAEYAGTSLPLRHHDEMGGSWQISEEIAAAAGDERGVFLFPGGSNIYSVNRNAPGAVWWLRDQIAGRLPADYDIGTIDEYRDAFPDQPVFVVSDGNDLPAQLPAARFDKSRVVVEDLHVWEERPDRRPSEEVVMRLGVTVWRLVE